MTQPPRLSPALRERAPEGGGGAGRPWGRGQPWMVPASAPPREPTPLPPDRGLPAPRRPSVNASTARAPIHGQEGPVAAAAVVAGRGGPRRPPAAVRPHPRRLGAALPQGARSGVPAPGAVRGAAGPGCAREAALDPYPRSGPGPAGWSPRPREHRSRPRALCSPPGPPGGSGASWATRCWRPKSRELPAYGPCHGCGLGAVSSLPGRSLGAPYAAAGHAPSKPVRPPGAHRLRVRLRWGSTGAGAQGTLPTSSVAQTVRALPLRGAWRGQPGLVLKQLGWARPDFRLTQPPGVRLAPLTLYCLGVGGLQSPVPQDGRSQGWAPCNQG